MNCYECGDTIILKKIYDYGGYAWGWKCSHCKAIVDQALSGDSCMKEDTQHKSGINEVPIARANKE